MAATGLRRHLLRLAVGGVITGALLAVPLVMMAERRYWSAALLTGAMTMSALIWLEVPRRVRKRVRRGRIAAAPVIVRSMTAEAPPAGVPVIAMVPRPRRYKAAVRGRQVQAITSLAARGRDAQSIARELRVPYDVVQFALTRRMAA